MKGSNPHTVQGKEIEMSRRWGVECRPRKVHSIGFSIPSGETALHCIPGLRKLAMKTVTNNGRAKFLILTSLKTKPTSSRTKLICTLHPEVGHNASCKWRKGQIELQRAPGPKHASLRDRSTIYSRTKVGFAHIPRWLGREWYYCEDQGLIPS